jgi:hypothetical protein
MRSHGPGSTAHSPGCLPGISLLFTAANADVYSEPKRYLLGPLSTALNGAKLVEVVELVETRHAEA